MRLPLREIVSEELHAVVVSPILKKNIEQTKRSVGSSG